MSFHLWRKLHTRSTKGSCAAKPYLFMCVLWRQMIADLICNFRSVSSNKLDFTLCPLSVLSIFYGNKCVGFFFKGRRKEKLLCFPPSNNFISCSISPFSSSMHRCAVCFKHMFCVVSKAFTPVLSSLSSSWGLPGWCGELPCSHSCRSFPACSHYYCSAGLFHREKEKHGCWLRVFLISLTTFRAFFFTRHSTLSIYDFLFSPPNCGKYLCFGVVSNADFFWGIWILAAQLSLLRCVAAR